MKSAAPYALAVQPRERRPVAKSGGGGVRVEERDGLVWVIGRDGIAQPCSSPRVAALVAASVRNLGKA